MDPEKTKQVITAVVRAGSRELSLEETGCYRTVGVWESDENLKALCAAMNSRRTKQLRYVFGDASEVLSGETMASWITGSSNGQVTLDQEKSQHLWQIWRQLTIQQERHVPLQG